MNKKLTIARMTELAELKKGRVLSEVYVDTKTKLLFECAEGHKFKMTPSAVQQGRWCQICGKVRTKEFFNYRVPPRRSKVTASGEMEEYVREKYKVRR